jgi:ubiquinone/menaquinone biosynthesis C-methylase UbiE
MNHIVPILKEIFSPQVLVRTPEPMIMSDFEQTQQYFEYGQSDTVFRASYLFHAKWASKTIQNCKKVIDLGTGPANQLIIIAKLNPHIKFYGVDLSEQMIEIARKNCKDLDIKNVDFIYDDISKLASVEDHSFDGAISSVALHHLNDKEDLENSFRNLNRVLKKEHAVYITDFLLLKNPASLDYLVSLNKNQPDLFKLDYINSLKASFFEKDFRELKDKYFPTLEIHKTLGAKFLMILKSQSNQLNKETEMMWNYEFKNLGKENQKIYKNLSMLFALMT